MADRTKRFNPPQWLVHIVSAGVPLFGGKAYTFVSIFNLWKIRQGFAGFCFFLTT